MPADEKMNVSAVLEQLNTALPLQLRSANQYLLAASGATGLHALTLEERFWSYAQAEFADARVLASKIVALGGRPATETLDLKDEADPGASLDYLMTIENETLSALHAVIPDTGQEPDSEALEHLIEHLIMRKQNQLDILIRARSR